MALDACAHVLNEPIHNLKGFRINRYDGKVRKAEVKLCNTGQVCIAINPKGEVYRCWGQLRARYPSLGNLFTDYQLLTKSKECDLECPHCFVEGQYGIRMEVID